MCECMFVCVNARMPNCPASDQSGTRMNRTKDTRTGPVPYQTKLTQFGIFLVRYRTKILDARMPMPELVSSMPALVSWMQMPSYG
jgi:hypothetical protein